jgi:CubicO group peptidase (beta-lactamase class C family)
MAADRRQAELERTLREGMARYHSVGASAAIVTSDGVAWEMHAGLARRDPPRPCGPDTIYDWGSITKLFCAIAIMQLRDRGRLRIDDSAVRHLPCLARVQNPFGNTEAITLEHLLTHTSGLQGASTPEPLPPGAPWPLWPDVEASMPRIKVEAPPGARYEYSNLGIMLAGRVVELLTRDEWEPHVTKNILMPLGMHEAYFDQTP